ncbi:25S rRNA (uracil2634-N3)-methyltransferase [Aspergillus melleus]|uniref:25S rRNA (uracil2634-N3)-methyltransferase n=1 Tax=Aspergillus melleus TaxID=138277 RepID=UPI001E8E2D90|nr:uncharacterized protein LDX57_012341 [Aspergillus melleus]KAH8434701.1 hypothetical protein LDX57_012341 [Aspergillus melleus]
MPKPSKKARSQGPVTGKKGRKMHTFPKLSTAQNQNSNSGSAQSHSQTQSKKQPNQQRRPVIPFGRNDHVLLVGEGDFSFARSLVTQHRCRHVLATCYDSKEMLCEKYPKTEGTISEILGAFSKKKAGGEAVSNKDQTDQEGPGHVAAEDRKAPGNIQKNRGPNVLFSVDARKLGLAAGGGKDVRQGFYRRERKRPAWIEAKEGPSSAATKGGPWDIICFNFPHVGGLSTDVNRQVRANQELLVAFFKACVPLLSSPQTVDRDVDEDEWEYSDDDEEDSDLNEQDSPSADAPDSAKSQVRTEPGQILVTMFEGEPYTLWNIRDLARHAGLKVVTSFKFPWGSYKDYSHARTIGDIEGKHGGRGGWRGEDREARMYVFEVKQEERPAPRRNPNSSGRNGNAGTKRSRDASESDSD